MQWYYISGQRQIGPVWETVLIDKIRSGEIRRSTLVWNAPLGEWVAAGDSVLAAHFPGGLSAGRAKERGRVRAWERGRVGALAGKVMGDLRELKEQFLLPIQEARSLRWLKDETFWKIAGAGLFPLVCVELFVDLKSSYWALALYFSAVWALFLHAQFASPQVSGRQSLVCFFGTGLVSITVLVIWQRLWPISLFGELARSNALITRFVGMLLGVAVWEELCKALLVFYTLKRAVEKLRLQTLLFYGLMCGLGFGIYEGVSYQLGFNLTVRDLGAYYLLNVIRLTTLPFLHAVWTGLAGYFIGLSVQHPDRRHGLLVGAILAPSLLHALHNTFGVSLIGLAVDLLSVLALMVYLRQSLALVPVFREKRAAAETPAAPVAGGD